MKTSLTRDSASKVRVQVEATSEEVEPAVQRAVRSLSNQVKVPGFRKGHVPRKVLETRLGAEALRDAVLREAIPELLQKATEEELDSKLAEAKTELFNLRFQAATGQLESHGRLRAVRKEIARIYTVKRERELGIVTIAEETEDSE